EGEGRFSRSREAGHHGERIARNLDGDILEIVFARAADGDVLQHAFPDRIFQLAVRATRPQAWLPRLLTESRLCGTKQELLVHEFGLLSLRFAKRHRRYRRPEPHDIGMQALIFTPPAK